jgi:hypothetical protein
MEKVVDLAQYRAKLVEKRIAETKAESEKIQEALRIWQDINVDITEILEEEIIGTMTITWSLPDDS